MDLMNRINNDKKLKNLHVVSKCNGYNYGFCHITTIFYKNYMITAKIGYINRTWERYTYETSTRACLQKLVNEIYNDLKNDYKKQNNIKRITQKDKKTIVEMLDKNNKELVHLYNILSDYKAIKKASKILYK